MLVSANEGRVPNAAAGAISLRKVAVWPGLRVLAWDRDVLYASRGYELLRLSVRDLQSGDRAQLQTVASFNPVWWRKLTARTKLTCRLFRDGFHALAVLEDRTMISAVPGAIAIRECESPEFKTTHEILRGTRPLHITAVPNGNIYWGEYFDNRERAEVHLYVSIDRGQSWQIAHTFPPGAIRHVHNIIYDRYADCLWILTGDEGKECKILRADRDLRNIEIILEGNQQVRAVAAIPTEGALYLATDTPFEQNHILRLSRSGQVEPVADLSSSAIYGCQTANALFFSTMVEPSRMNTTRESQLAGSPDGNNWQTVAKWRKDALPMRYFQYGNAILPNGANTTNFLATTAIAVEHDDQVTTLWEVTTNSEDEQLARQSPTAPSLKPGAQSPSS